MITTTGYDIRPNKLETEKGEKYHTDMGRWILNMQDNVIQEDFIIKTIVNWSFFNNNQWIFDEDLISFLDDTTGAITSRIKLVENLIEPIVRQFKGNVILSDYSYEAKYAYTNTSIVNRRETSLEKMLLISDIAEKAGGPIGEALKKDFPIGKDATDTELIFNNYFTDSYRKGINALINIIAEENEIEQKKVELVPHLALSGLGILKTFEQNGNQETVLVDPLYYIRDVNAVKPDLSDSEYEGEVHYMTSTSLFERFSKISATHREAIENYASTDMGTQTDDILYHIRNVRGKVPVYELYWKDGEFGEWGWVKDESNYPFFTRINTGEEGSFTDKDLIKPKSKKAQEEVGPDLKVKRWHETLRYVIFVPKEYVPNPNEGVHTDIVLEYGEVPFAEKDVLRPSDVKSPYKKYCYNYHDGYIGSIIDSVIDPQRFLNRLMSSTEAEINSARPGGNAIADDAIEGVEGGEEEIRRNMNTGSTIFLKAPLGIQNAIGQYGDTLSSATLNKYNIAEQVRKIVENNTAVNEQMKGATQGADQLVGVMKGMIRMGTIMQQDFYYALGEILKQTYQAYAQQGKQIYSENERKFAMFVGDDHAEQLMITKDFLNEAFRIVIKRSKNQEEAVSEGTLMATQMLQLGLLDQSRYAQLLNRATAEDVAVAVRDYAKEVAEVERERAARAEQAIEERNEQGARKEQLALDMVDKVQNAEREKEAVKNDATLANTALKEGMKQKFNKKTQSTGISA
jgi:hypothetical protein